MSDVWYLAVMIVVVVVLTGVVRVCGWIVGGGADVEVDAEPSPVPDPSTAPSTAEAP